MIAIIMAIITIFSITNILALFETNAYSVNDLDIGRWKIYVNDVDTYVSETIDINSFTFSSNSHTADNYFAPGRTVYYDIELDATLIDESLLYTLTATSDILEDHPNIVLSYFLLDTNTTITDTTISEVIAYNDLNRVRNIRVVLTWNNNSQYDEEDTSLIGEDFEIELELKCEQYLER